MTKGDAIEALRAHFSEDTVWNLVEVLVKAEREECAKACENEYIDFDWAHVEQHAAEICAEVIRARKCLTRSSL